jgi:hypothetical protein
MKKYSLSLAIKEMPINTTLRFHLNPVRAKGTLIHCWWECKLVRPLWKAVSRLLKRLKIKLPYDPAILFLGIYPKEYKSR